MKKRASLIALLGASLLFPAAVMAAPSIIINGYDVTGIGTPGFAVAEQGVVRDNNRILVVCIVEYVGADGGRNRRQHGQLAEVLAVGKYIRSHALKRSRKRQVLNAGIPECIGSQRRQFVAEPH